jgi:pfkB family carbohydrate kinase
VVNRGKTPVLTSDQARVLLDSIDTSTLVGLRDRALIGVMTYAFARIGAVVAMRVEDYFANGKRWWVRLHEKGGKRHEMPEASEAGTVVFFEPNAIKDAALFRRAIGFVDILKVSEEIGSIIDFEEGEEPPYFITTHGSSGLSLKTSVERLEFPSFVAPRLVDTCGAGDMVTTGLIHALMSTQSKHRSVEIGDVCFGLHMGQWLAAQNCAFIGARGLFHAFDGRTIRKALTSVPTVPASTRRREPVSSRSRHNVGCWVNFARNTALIRFTFMLAQFGTMSQV